MSASGTTQRGDRLDGPADPSCFTRPTTGRQICTGREIWSTGREIVRDGGDAEYVRDARSGRGICTGCEICKGREV
jgi:hypothetical protein